MGISGGGGFSLRYPSAQASPPPSQERGKMGETKVIVSRCIRREIQSFHGIYEMASSPILCAMDNHDLPEALSPGLLPQRLAPSPNIPSRCGCSHASPIYQLRASHWLVERTGAYWPQFTVLRETDLVRIRVWGSDC